MLTCDACAFENPGDFRFCGQCGSPLAAPACGACGASVVPGNRFCGQCGAAVEGAVPGGVRPVVTTAAVEERKLATVLFADVVGFTTISETADPETIARTVDGAFRRLAEVVTDHEGTVDKYMGDSLMAVFGVPQSHDDDAERAVAAALAMRGVGGELGFSIGVNSGEVMVTELGAGGGMTVVGDTVNVAARLEKVAGCDEVLVGPLTAELARERVSFAERQPMVLKGKREPVKVFEAVGLRPSGDTDGASYRPPLVGRDDELAFLLSQWRRVRRDRRTVVVLLTGDMGVGTTRLADEVVAELADEALVARSTYPAYGALGGPRVAAELLEQLGSVADEEIAARLESAAGHSDPKLRGIDPGALHQEQLWAFRRMLETKAAEQPLVLVIDDLHRAGEGTLGLLADLAVVVTDVPLMLLLVGRPEPAEWLARFPSATTVRLSPLSQPDAVALANALVAERPLTDEAASALADRAGGNPLYVRELLAVVRDQGGLVTEDGSYRLAAGLRLPPSLQAIVAARLDALSPVEKAAVQQLAVFGAPADAEQLERLGVNDSRQSLRSLVSTGLLAQNREGCYDIVDPLLREVAYESLPHVARSERHRQAAEVAGDVDERARHLHRAASFRSDDAELADQAIRALSLAGVQALDVNRTVEGMRMLESALELGLREPRPLLRLARARVDLLHTDTLHEVIDLVPERTGDPELDLERAHLAAWSHRATSPETTLAALDEVAAGWAGIGNTEKEGWARSNRGVVLFTMGRVAEAEDELVAALERFERIGYQAGIMAVYRFLPIVRPDDPESAEWLTRSLDYAVDVGDRSAQVGALDSLSWHHFVRGRYGDARSAAAAEDYVERLVALCDELGMVEFAIHGLCIASDLARATGRLDRAAELARRALAMPLSSHPSARALARSVAFGAQLARGDAAPLPPQMDSLDPVASVATVIQAESLLLAGRSDEANALLRSTGSRANLEALQSLVGGVPVAWARLAAGAYDEAVAKAGEARRTAMAAGAGPMAAAAVGIMAEAAARTGDRGEAERLLGSIHPSVAGPGGIAGALVDRARAVLGDEEAVGSLGRAAEDLAAPGFLVGLEEIAPVGRS